MTITYEIGARALPDQNTAVQRGEVPAVELPDWLANAFRTVHKYLQRIGTSPSGPPFARFTFLADSVAVEAGFPVSKRVPGDTDVQPSVLPGGQAAVTTHIGRYEDLDKAYQAIQAWLDKHGFVPAGPHWEVYYTDPSADPDPSRWRTEVVAPYRNA
jgi:effector-binding domain-containing protein